MHALLARQLHAHRGGADKMPEDWHAFIAAVDAMYREADDDRALRERTMEVMLRELTKRNEQLQQEKSEQAQLIKRLEQTRHQLLQSEKLASIGQLAAGVAHEINNPIGFVNSNLGSLAQYFERLIRVIEHFEANGALLAGLGEAGKSWADDVAALMAATDFAYLKDDIPALLAESRDGIERVRKIVLDLRDFSHIDKTQHWEITDLRSGLEATLNILHNEIASRADVIRQYAPLPAVECLSSQLNQVFTNLLVNAAQAMPEGKRGTITIRCGQAGNAAGDSVWIEIADDGTGIPPENLKKIFDPFFTTKPVGKGTGLGLSLVYGIVQKHGGDIAVTSQPGVGTSFRITLPIRQSRSAPVVSE